MIDFERELNFAKALAKEAEEIALKYFSFEVESTYKDDHTPLTKADTEINDLVIKKVKETYPEHSIYGEEASYKKENSKYIWVCDPIDGTMAFACGLPIFVFSIALVDQSNGLPVLGLINDPIMKTMYWAYKGSGAYRNGFEYDLNSKTLKESLDNILENPKNVERAGDVYSFYKDLEKSIETITKKCKLNSYQFWVVGNRTVKKENLKTSQIIIEMGEHYGLKHVHTIARNIPNKVMPSLNSPTNEVGQKVTTMTNEHILVLRKEKL